MGSITSQMSSNLKKVICGYVRVEVCVCGYACSTWFYIARVRFQWEVGETHEFHLARFALWLFTCKYCTENCTLNVVKY